MAVRGPWLVQLFLALCLAGVFRLWPLPAYRRQRADGAPLTCNASGGGA